MRHVIDMRSLIDMRPVIALFVFQVIGCVCLQAAAAGPPATVEPAEGLDSAKISAAADGVPAARVPPPSEPAAAPPTASVSNVVSDAQIKALRSKGYKPLVRDGKTVFCRSEATLGSRLEHQTCRTAEQLDEAAQQGQDMGHDIQRGGNLGIRDKGH